MNSQNMSNRRIQEGNFLDSNTYLTTRTGYPFKQLTLNAALSFSNFWSKACSLFVRLFPLKSLPPLSTCNKNVKRAHIWYKVASKKRQLRVKSMMDLFVNWNNACSYFTSSHGGKSKSTCILSLTHSSQYEN